MLKSVCEAKFGGQTNLDSVCVYNIEREIGVAFITINVGVIPRFFNVYVSTTKFKRYVKNSTYQ